MSDPQYLLQRVKKVKRSIKCIGTKQGTTVFHGCALMQAIILIITLLMNERSHDP